MYIQNRIVESGIRQRPAVTPGKTPRSKKRAFERIEKAAVAARGDKEIAMEGLHEIFINDMHELKDGELNISQDVVDEINKRSFSYSENVAVLLCKSRQPSAALLLP